MALALIRLGLLVDMAVHIDENRVVGLCDELAILALEVRIVQFRLLGALCAVRHLAHLCNKSLRTQQCHVLLL